MIFKNVFKFLSLLNNPGKVYTVNILQEGTLSLILLNFTEIKGIPAIPEIILIYIRASISPSFFVSNNHTTQTFTFWPLL